MSYCIKTITEEGLIDFLLNPFEKACYLDNKLFQKYPKEDLVDELLVINDRYSSYDITALINYQKQEIFVQKERPFTLEMIQEKPFIRVADLKKSLKESMFAKLEEKKTLNFSEIEKTPAYISCYHKCKRTYFQPMINNLLGANHYYGSVSSDTQSTINSYVQGLPIEKLIDFHCDKFTEVDTFLDKIIASDNYVNGIAFEKVKQEAEAYFNAGVFTEKEKHLKNFIEKTKDCGAQRFTVVQNDGTKVSYRNEVSAEGKLFAAGSSNTIYVEEIKEVIYKSKKIYKRGEF